jgi:flavin reductase
VTDPVDQSVLRGALSRFASGVTVVTTVLDGVDHAMTASAFTSVSLDPPQVLVCSQRTSRFHDAVMESGIWGVSILSDHGRAASAWFAHSGRPLEGQLEDVPHHRGDLGVPLLDASLAWLECRTIGAHDGGTHTILVGEVTSAAVQDQDDDPLIHYRSHYGTIVRAPESETAFHESGDA